MTTNVKQIMEVVIRIQIVKIQLEAILVLVIMDI